MCGRMVGWAPANVYQINVTRGSGQNLQMTPTNKNRVTDYGYDGNGNLNSGGGITNYYDAENRITSITGGYAYPYDGDGRKVQSTTGGVTTMYWRDPGGNTLAETDASGNTRNNYVFFNGVNIARSDVASGRVDYSYLHDHLGTTRMMVDATGHVCYDADYFPFGWEQSRPINTCGQNYKFTGKERDPNTGLDYFGARWYAGTIARFMTPDWSAIPVPVPYADLTDPQTLNLYSYVRNNPLARVDSDGHLADWASGDREGLNADSVTTEKSGIRERLAQNQTSASDKRTDVMLTGDSCRRNRPSPKERN